MRKDLIKYLQSGKKEHSWHELAEKFGFSSGEAARAYYRRHKAQVKTESFVEEGKVTRVKTWQLHDGSWRESIQYEEVKKASDVVQDIKDAFKDYKAPKVEICKSKNKGKYCAIINLFDAHIDKLCLLDETDKNSSIEENIRVFEKAFDELLANCQTYNPETIYIPVGSDFWNSNNTAHTTKGGTPQDVIGKIHNNFKIGLSLYRRCIDKAAYYSDVVCPVLAGNHDEDMCYFLGTALEVAYENSPNVFIDNTRHQRKYYKYGQNLFGFAHGDKEKNKVANLPLLMAEERKHDWADTTYREWYLGDIHHKQEYKFLRGKDYVGCMVRFLRSVATSDKWHHDNGYIGVPKTAEAFIWSTDRGMKANFATNI